MLRKVKQWLRDAEFHFVTRTMSAPEYFLTQLVWGMMFLLSLLSALAGVVEVTIVNVIACALLTRLQHKRLEFRNLTVNRQFKELIKSDGLKWRAAVSKGLIKEDDLND